MKKRIQEIGNLKRLAGVMVGSSWQSETDLAARLDELAERFGE